MKRKLRSTYAATWAQVFEERPDLEPPGFKETVEVMRQLKAIKDETEA